MGNLGDHLAALRHDLCTPINQILGYSELLEEEVEEGEPASADDLRKIQQAARNMLQLVRNRLTDALLESDLDPSQPAQGLAATLPAAEPVSQSISPPEHPAGRVGRILAVDDDPLNLDLLAQRLRRQGHTVTVAVDGEDALQRLGQKAFDLVLLDVMMPNLDGYDTLVRIKAHERWRAIPVIMISALDELSSVVRCIESGAEDYLPKPFNPTLLRARIGACLDKKAHHDQEVDLYNSLVKSQQRLEHDLASARRCVADLDPDVARDPRVVPLMQAFARMTGALSRRQTDLRTTIQDLEIQINRKAVQTQVTSIVNDPSFMTLSERVRAMRASRQGREGSAG